MVTWPGTIEYRKLQRDGKCGVCNKELKKEIDEVTIVHTTISKHPTISICRDCAYKIFYAPILADKNNVVIN